VKKCKGVLGRESTYKGEIKWVSCRHVVGEVGGWDGRCSGRKLGHEGGGRWVPRDSIFCALIRAVCTPVENPDLLSCDGGFLRSYRSRRDVSMTCSDRSCHHCSCCWDQAQSKSLPLLCDPCI
jgi:hypothetical protein